MEVGRMGVKFGIEPPTLIKLEMALEEEPPAPIKFTGSLDEQVWCHFTRFCKFDTSMSTITQLWQFKTRDFMKRLCIIILNKRPWSPILKLFTFHTINYTQYGPFLPRFNVHVHHTTVCYDITTTPRVLKLLIKLAFICLLYSTASYSHS